MSRARALVTRSQLPPRWRWGLVGVATLIEGLRVGSLTGRHSWLFTLAAAGGLSCLLLLVPFLLWRRAGAAWGRRGPLLVGAALVVLTSGGLLLGHLLVAVLRPAHHPAIAGAPGYATFRGPHARPLAVGRPWGVPCRPVRLSVERSVPDAVYDQVRAVVAEARTDGIDVTLESRAFTWSPASLFYAGGQTPADVVRVAVFADDRPPPRLAGGGLQHVLLGWDASLDPDHRHEHLVDESAQLRLRALAGDPAAERKAVRQLLALTQGIISTSRRDSGLRAGDAPDAFSPADVHAMQIMSGCGAAPGGVTAQPA